VVDVRVGYDVDSLQGDLDSALPGEHIRVANFADGVLLTGEVSTPAVAARASRSRSAMRPRTSTPSLASPRPNRCRSTCG